MIESPKDFVHFCNSQVISGIQIILNLPSAKIYDNEEKFVCLHTVFKVIGRCSQGNCGKDDKKQVRMNNFSVAQRLILSLDLLGANGETKLLSLNIPS